MLSTKLLRTLPDVPPDETLSGVKVSEGSSGVAIFGLILAIGAAIGGGGSGSSSSSSSN